MDEQTRKRKMEDEEESEEEKIEKFFALIRSTREVHERMTTGRTLVRPKEKGEKEKPPNDEKAQGWKLSFQPQDFMGDDARLKTIDIHQGSLLPSPSKKKEDENKEEDLKMNAQLKTVNIDQGNLDPSPSKKREEEKDNPGDGLDLDLKL